ncbi:MAG: AEC family transporter [Lachnospiraceae bacterium]|nr:AEC family transporter [Lachnospiraceae bacterium]
MMISSVVIVEQMLVICLLILIGAFLYKKKLLTDEGTRQISTLIVQITNPAIMLSTAIEEEEIIPPAEIGRAFALAVAAYALSALAGFLISLLLRSDAGDRIAIVMMTMYANVGFIGIPLALATLGTRSMVYVTINNLVYSLLFYTTGIPLIRRSAMIRNGTWERKKTDGSGRSLGGWRDALKSLMHIGTIAAILSVFIYLFHPEVPSLIADPLLYAGRCTTFLSMLVLGVSVAGSPVRKWLTDKKIWVFVLLRGIVTPVAVSLMLSPFIHDDLLTDVVLLLVAVPSGSLPMIVSREQGLDDQIFARGIILSTLFSPVTIPVAAALAHFLMRL